MNRFQPMTSLGCGTTIFQKRVGSLHSHRPRGTADMECSRFLACTATYRQILVHNTHDKMKFTQLQREVTVGEYKGNVQRLPSVAAEAQK